MAEMELVHVSDAREELKEKTILEIERETAKTWGGRAAAAYEFAKKASGDDRLRWLSDAENYRQESLEHAAMTEDVEFFKVILSDLEAARQGLNINL